MAGNQASPEIKLKNPVMDIFRNTDPDKQKKDGDIYRLPIVKMVPFFKHIFRLYTGKKLEDLADSIKKNGVFNPIIVRKIDDDHYEIIAGHNRVEASKMVGIEDIPAIIREVDDDTATLMMIETNLNQREQIPPSERAAAYKLQMEILNRQGERSDLTSRNDCEKLSCEEIGRMNNKSARTVLYYIRLNYLIPDFLDMADEGKLKLIHGVDLSYLTPEHQQTVYELIQDKGHKLTDANANKLKELARENKLDDEQIEEIISVTKPTSKAPSVKRTVTKIMKQYRLPANRVNDFIQIAVEEFVRTERYRKEFDAGG